MAYENLTDQLAILRRQDLSATERFVAIVALSFRNAESGRCNPPVYSDDAEKESLCSRSGYTKQCITKTLAALEAKRVIVLKKHVARPSEITFTVNDVYGKQGLPSTTITTTVNDVYGEGKRRLPITDKEQTSNRQVSASSAEAAPTTPASSKPFRRDQKENTGAAKTEKTQRNSLIQKKNMDAPSVAPNPADSMKQSASNSLIGKEIRGADGRADPRGTRFTLENLPDDWRAECRRIQPKADPVKVFEEFRDHWIAQPGAKGRKSDWLATWRNWCRRLNARDLERVGYEAGRSQFIATPQNSGPQRENIFRVKPATLPQPKTPEQIAEERSYDLFCRVLDGKAEGDCDDPFA